MLRMRRRVERKDAHINGKWVAGGTTRTLEIEVDNKTYSFEANETLALLHEIEALAPVLREELAGDPKGGG